MSKVDFEKLDAPYFIGEIGINHNGDIQIAKKLIDATFATGWHCAKFQKRTPALAVPEHQKSVMRDTPWGKMTYLDYKYKVEFEKKEYDYIDKYCREKPLSWTASVWDIPSLEFLLQYDVPFIKIPSAHLTNLELVKACAASKVPLVISTGMSTWEEVDASVNLIIKTGVKPVIMHTNSSYPTPRNELNLSLIPALQKRYGCVVGYSGHEPDLEPTVLAVSLGAKVIERHITIDHELWGTDQKSSLSITGMDMLFKRAKDMKAMMGTAEKVVTPSEVDMRKKLRG
ncbi:MAG: N-acetylneuraminate synthase family protein [Bdellovibrionota bacterium]